MSRFIVENKADWEELERLVARARRSLRGMSAEELTRLDVLYRRTTLHLAQAGTRTTDAKLIHYLNSLTAAAHSVIYLSPRRSVFAGAARFMKEGFARAVARTWRYHAVSALLMLAGALLAYVAVVRDPLTAYSIMPAGEVRLPGATAEQLQLALRAGRGESGGTKFFFASFLFQHNLKVGLLSMATGVLAGIPTVLLTFYNGMMVGAFSAIHHLRGIYADYWAWILPHGVSELWAIVLFGGVGLMFGHALISPGRRSRAESLRDAGVEAAKICVGAGAMLVVAAIAESYVRQSNLPNGSRLLLAGATALFWLAYFAGGFRAERAVRGVRPGCADAATGTR